MLCGPEAVLKYCCWCIVAHGVAQELLFEAKGANSVAWNSHFEDMLCYSGNGQLVIKTGDFPLHLQKMQGFVVGFKVTLNTRMQSAAR
jgi:hypothetical protein